MKTIISNLNKIFENRLRLGIMSILMVNEELDFKHLKQLLDATDGNLSTHLKALENKGLIKSNKEFVGRKPRSTYLATNKGKQAFIEHLNFLQNLIENSKK